MYIEIRLNYKILTVEFYFIHFNICFLVQQVEVVLVQIEMKMIESQRSTWLGHYFLIKFQLQQQRRTNRTRFLFLSVIYISVFIEIFVVVSLWLTEIQN